MFELMPSRRANSLANYFDTLEKSFWGDFAKGWTDFKTDILDKGDHYLMEAELPGFSKEDIHISMDGNLLTIQAEHSDEKENKEEQYVRKERSYGSYTRSFDISNIKADEISASYNNGVLELTLPKAEPSKPQAKTIEIR